MFSIFFNYVFGRLTNAASFDTLNEQIEPLLLSGRKQLVDAQIFEPTNLLYVDLFALAILALLSLAIWCCVMREAQNITLTLLKLLLLATMASVIGGIAVSVFYLAAREHTSVARISTVIRDALLNVTTTAATAPPISAASATTAGVPMPAEQTKTVAEWLASLL